MRSWLASLLCLLWIDAAAGAEVLKRYDADGKLVYEAVMSGDRVAEEIDYRYDSDNRLIEKKTSHEGRITRERTQYLRSGRVAREETWAGTRLMVRRTYLYRKGRLAYIIEETALGRRRTTAFAYDDAGRSIQTETRNERGRLISREVSYREPVRTPFRIDAAGGGSFRSDVPAFDLSLGARLTRDPHQPGYQADPFELKLGLEGGRLQAGSSPPAGRLLGLVDLGFHMKHPWEVFLGARALRSGVVGIPLELELAPLGIRLGHALLPAFTLHGGLAPVWHFRAVGATGDDCGPATNVTGCAGSTSIARLEFQGAATWYGEKLRATGRLELLPALNDDGTDPRQGGTIVRAGLELELALSRRVALRQSIGLTRDPTLAMVPGCTEGGFTGGGTLCAGRVATSETSLVVRFDLGR